MLDGIPDGYAIPLTPRLLKQPTTDKEETRQSEQEEHIVPSHPLIPQAIVADMRIDHENHRESPHCVNITYSLLCHDACKDTNKKSKCQINLFFCALIRTFAT